MRMHGAALKWYMWWIPAKGDVFGDADVDFGHRSWTVDEATMNEP
jgi:hypothetical protein